MRRRRARAVVAWSLTIGVTWVVAASAQERQAPAMPALPMWTPGGPVVPPMASVPWATPNAFAAQRGERRTESIDLSFADPSKPGAFVVNLFSGSIRVKAANRKDVGIRITHSGRTSLLPRKPEPPPAGMRRLTPPSFPETVVGERESGNQNRPAPDEPDRGG